MPLNANEEALLGILPATTVDLNHQRVEYAPKERSKIGKWTVVALALNRTIGSGIFLTPHTILAGTGCVGGALILWVLGALISTCGLYTWLECSLSMPQRRVRGEAEPRGVPRSGGEKNFLEFMFPNSRLRLPHIRTTCSFSIMFVLMYNLSGNAISFGLQVLIASGYYDKSSGEVPDRGIVIGIAVAALSAVVMIHMVSRKLGIWINNLFAILKVGLLLAIICLGIAKAAGKFGGSGDVPRNNFTRDVWKTQRSDAASWSNSLVLCLYAFSGFEQPFYVLAETKSPRRYFPKYTVLAMITAGVLFLLVNISFLLVVDKADIIPQGASDIPGTLDMATRFFDGLWETDPQGATRAMAAIIAVSIFGNLWVMTFTAARVKQEIAKEGILGGISLYIASSYRTPWALCKQWFRASTQGDEIEQAPTAAFGLHWFTSVFLLAVTAAITDPRKTYFALVSLYSYTIILVLGFWVSIGLILTKMRKEKFHWQERRRYRPWLSPAHPIIYGLATGFMLIAAFIPPQRGSPFHSSVTGFAWYIIPTVGITAPLWGILWYWGFLVYESRIKQRQLVVTREAYWAKDPDCPGEYVQLAEIIDHTWEVGAPEGLEDDEFGGNVRNLG
ncbi:uncharacterized protein RCC_03907 [Ramularia collo-cygni]|uniref:Amino acid transporter n=1 Tax=Ramularia collo-cygni TaxID=112498 RepID=A0A2D3V985_9PEZI|nr:uncharacterized protein RCC_03907 [Ramularia collo-cygni]CZT18069.1 uncharacterized protein RCC_03907 [Ramularia collo-cygni]